MTALPIPHERPRATSSRPLTERQAQVLDYIRSYRRENGYAPALRDIGKRFGIRSTNGCSDHLKALERKGFIEVDHRVSRGIVVLDQGGRTDVEVIADADARDDLTRENVQLRALLRRAYVVLEQIGAASLDVDGVRADLAQEVGVAVRGRANVSQSKEVE